MMQLSWNQRDTRWGIVGRRWYLTGRWVYPQPVLWWRHLHPKDTSPPSTHAPHQHLFFYSNLQYPLNLRRKRALHRSTQVLQCPPSRFAHNHLLKPESLTHSLNLPTSSKVWILIKEKTHWRDTKTHQSTRKKEILASACVWEREAEVQNQTIHNSQEGGEDLT